MKTRRALQIIVGILSLLVVLCLLVATVSIVFLLYAREGLFDTGSAIALNIYHGLNSIAGKFGLTGGLKYLVPALFYGLPCVLLLLAAILLFLHKSPKQAKYVAGSVLALTGATIFTVFTIVFAPELVHGQTPNGTLFSWTSADTIVRFAASGLLGVFVIFVGSALGVKPKREQVVEVVEEETIATVEEETVTEDVTEEQQVVELQVVEEEVSEQPVVEETEVVAEETPATEYVPNTDVTVNDIVQNTYGSENEELSADAVAKINKLRALLEVNAISQEEYLKLVNIYLGKKA